MSKLMRVMLSVSLVVMTFTVLQQHKHLGMSRSAAAAETATAQAPAAQTHYLLRQLRLERKRLLDEIAEDIKRTMEAGQSSMTVYMEARIASLTAGIDLCETKEDRIAIHAEIIKLHGKTEALITRLVESGQAHQVDLDKAKVARLESEIDLLKEKLKQVN